MGRSATLAAGRGLFFRVLDHELNIRGGRGYERFSQETFDCGFVPSSFNKGANGFVAFLPRGLTTSELSNDSPRRERVLPFAASDGRELHPVGLNVRPACRRDALAEIDARVLGNVDVVGLNHTHPGASPGRFGSSYGHSWEDAPDADRRGGDKYTTPRGRR
jgi:hypothetical protein